MKWRDGTPVWTEIKRMPQPSFLHSSDSSPTGGWSAAPVEALSELGEVEMPSEKDIKKSTVFKEI